MSSREPLLLTGLGAAIWLGGAVGYRCVGALLFERGPVVLALTSIGMAGSVCFLLKAIMDWRKLPAADSMRVALLLILPGMFGNVAYTLAFAPITGLREATAGAYAAMMFFATAMLFLFALVRSGKAPSQAIS